MTINKEALQQLEQRYRATLINSLAGFKMPVLVGTKNTNNQTNLAIFNSLIHIGANPALWGLIFRPATVERHTLDNIINNHCYTINYVTKNIYLAAHQTSAKYTSSEFEATKLTPVYEHDFNAPFVAEAPINIAMRFEQRLDISINGTILVIGSIEHININEALINKDGFVDLSASAIIANTGLDAYYTTQLINRLSYAQANTWPQPI